METRSIKFFACTLVLASLIPLVSCKAPSVENTDSTIPDTTDTEDISTIIESDLKMDYLICNTPASEYTIIYNDRSESEEGKGVAENLAKEMKASLDVEIKAVTYPSTPFEHEIVVGKCLTRGVSEMLAVIPDQYSYRIESRDGNLYVVAGGALGYDCALLTLREDYFNAGKPIENGAVIEGSAFGKQIYALEEGSNLRLMSNNCWNCDTNKDAWQKKGEDCSYTARAPGLAAIYMAYYPDIICYQEMTRAMMAKLLEIMKSNGFIYEAITYSTSSKNDYLCIMYRPDRLTLKEQGHYIFPYGSDANSKGYTWGLFVSNETGKSFIATTTHMWWKSESAEAGSNNMREKQAGEISVILNNLSRKYSCPAFLLGDYNTSTSTDAFKVYMDKGFLDCFDIASVFADDRSGYHSCSATGYSRDGLNNPYKGKAIDHIIVKNPGDTDIRVFNHVTPYYYIKLSDHYPVYVDINIK